jgi:choloylglycine hydrolase
MDGINEKGLCVSILRVDIKEGDERASSPAGSSVILRYILDDCANISEAIEKVNASDITPQDWQDCHIFVTDADGNHVLIESRNSEVSIIETDVVTNFYLGSSDVEDSYYKSGNVREEAIEITDENGEVLYDFGYGHGYHRFVSIASQLERYQDPSREDTYTIMPEWAALSALQSAAQNPYTNVSGKSMTQYSAIYNNAGKKVEVWPFQNYQKSYIFDYTGKQY